MSGDPLRTSTFLLLMLLIGGCDSQDVDQKLLSNVGEMDFKVDVVVLEMRGEVLVSEWYPMVLYWGYADDGNMRGCLNEASRLNKEEGIDRFRCAVVTKSSR